MFVWNKISTQSYSAKFLYWGELGRSCKLGSRPRCQPPLSTLYRKFARLNLLRFSRSSTLTVFKHAQLGIYISGSLGQRPKTEINCCLSLINNIFGIFCQILKLHFLAFIACSWMPSFWGQLCATYTRLKKTLSYEKYKPLTMRPNGFMGRCILAFAY